MERSKNIPIVNDKFDINIFIHIVKKSKWLILLVFLLIGISTGVYLRYAPRLYQASTVIQISNDNSSSKLLGVDNLYEDDQLAQIVELISSKKFLFRTLQKLPLKISYYSKGTFLSEELYKKSPIDISYNLKRPSIIGKPIYLKYINAEEYQIFFDEDQKDTPINGRFFEWVDIVGATVYIKLNSFAFFENPSNTDDFYFIFNNPSNTYSKYNDALEVRVKNPNAKTIEVSSIGEDPVKTSEIVNTIASNYLLYEIEKKKESTSSILSFIDQQTSLIYKNLNNTEQEIFSFKKENNIKSYNAKDFQPVNIFVAKINEFEDEIVSADLEVASLKQVQKELSKSDDINIFELIAITSGTSSENIVSNILNELQELLSNKVLLLNDVTSNNHKIQVIDRQINNQKEVLKEFITKTIDRLEKQKLSYTKKISEYESKIFSESNYDEIELSRLERYYSVQDKFYEKLIEKKAEYLISQAGYVSKNTILEEAIVPKYPISPNKKIIIIVAIILSIVVSIVVILIRYLFYDELSSIQELELYTSAPIIGSVPLVDMRNIYSQLIVHKDPNAIVTESFRTIRSNLDFFNLKNKGSLIVVSSTVSGEGKTFVAINLAGTLAMRGKKVVIIDLDLRKPKIHHSLNVENKQGMSRVLSGHLSLKDVINKSEIETLDYITADVIPPNPSELIVSQTMDDVLDELKEIYDYIIIDTSPIGLVADSVHLFKKASIPIYVLKANYSKRRFLHNIDYLQNKKKIDHVNVVLNGIDMRLNRNNYQYGYGYGYGKYGAENQKKKGFRKLFKRFKLNL